MQNSEKFWLFVILLTYSHPKIVLLLIKKSWGWDFEIMLLIKLVEHAQLCIQIFNLVSCFIVKKTRKLT